MCIIVDANVAGLVLSASPGPDYTPILRWLQRDGRIAYSRKLIEELRGAYVPLRLLAELNRAGKAILFPDEKIEVERWSVEQIGGYRSDDIHILALARASRVRLLCTNDNDLARDFTDKRFIDKPRGRVYRNATHRHLLRHGSTCPLLRQHS